MDKGYDGVEETMKKWLLGLMLGLIFGLTLVLLLRFVHRDFKHPITKRCLIEDGICFYHVFLPLNENQFVQIKVCDFF